MIFSFLAQWKTWIKLVSDKNNPWYKTREEKAKTMINTKGVSHIHFQKYIFKVVQKEKRVNPKVSYYCLWCQMYVHSPTLLFLSTTRRRPTHTHPMNWSDLKLTGFLISHSLQTSVSPFPQFYHHSSQSFYKLHYSCKNCFIRRVTSVWSFVNNIKPVTEVYCLTNIE